MANFLNHFATGGRFGVAGGHLAAARNAGYSDKQIATAIAQGGHGLLIGNKIRPGMPMHTQMAMSGKGKPGNWIHYYQNPSGLVGQEGLSRAIAEGRTPEELIAAGVNLAGANYGKNWGVPGFGLQASQWLLNQQQEEAAMQAPSAVDLADPTDPASKVDNTAGYTAQGLATPQPEGHGLNTGGTGEAFGRKKKKLGTANPALMINPITQ